MANSARLVAVLLITGGFLACERTKSENPLSPTIAGPLPNVSMTPPQPIEPHDGREVLDTEQPLVMIMANPTSSSPRPFSTDIQIATDSQFNNIVVTRNGVQPGEDGITRISLGDRLAAGHRYYWRGLGNDGANNSGWSGPSMFDVVVPVILGAPVPIAPIANSKVANVRPELRVRNGSVSGPALALFYEFQISSSPNFTQFIADEEVSQNNSGETRFTSPPLPSPDTPYYWRARLYDAKRISPWSRVEAFVSPSAPAPGPGPGPAPGGPALPPGSCASNSGQAIIACIGAKYPDRLAAGVSHGQRVANMEFLRDRMIEAGKCGGLDLGRNLKRGGPELSIDFLARNDGGGNVMGIDIGIDYDNTSIPLRLAWSEAGYGATFQPYPSVACQ